MKVHFTCFLLALAVFILDMNIPLGVAGGVPYIAVILITMYAQSKNVIILYACICSLLTLIGYYTSPVGGEHWKVIFNRCLALFAIWITCVLAYHWKKGNQQLAQSLEEITVKNKELNKLSLLISQAPTAIFITDRQGIIEYVNPAFENITGYSSEEAIGKNPRILNSGKNKTETYEEIWGSILSGKTWAGELINRKKDGSNIHVRSLILPMIDEKGETHHFGSIEQDVSDIRLTQYKLAESEDKFKHLIENAPVCIHEIDTKGKLMSMNQAGLDMMGAASEKEIIGLDYCSIPAKEDQIRIKSLFDKALDGNPSSFDFSVLIDKSLLYFSSSFVPIKNSDGDVTKIMGVTQNITKQKITEIQLKEALKMAEESGKIKEEFLSIISHELRTPMNGILGATELIKTFPNDLTNSINLLEESGQRMSETVEDILNFLDTTKEQSEITFRIVDLSKVQTQLEEKLLATQKLVEKQHIKISWGDWKGQINTEPIILQKVIWSLVSNALKFTSEGTIDINASVDEKSGQFTLDVIDTGCGIKKADQKRIFDNFTQIDSSLSRHAEGLGLGLALARKLTLLIDGKLEIVSSEENAGSHFQLRI